MWINGFCFLGQHTDTNEKSEIEINDEDYAAFARNSLSVNVIPSRKLSRELPPSGQGANFILNHMEREKSYKGRVSKLRINNQCIYPLDFEEPGVDGGNMKFKEITIRIFRIYEFRE